MLGDALKLTVPTDSAPQYLRVLYVAFQHQLLYNRGQISTVYCIYKVNVYYTSCYGSTRVYGSVRNVDWQTLNCSHSRGWTQVTLVKTSDPYRLAWFIDFMLKNLLLSCRFALLLYTLSCLDTDIKLSWISCAPALVFLLSLGVLCAPMKILFIDYFSLLTDFCAARLSKFPNQ